MSPARVVEELEIGGELAHLRHVAHGVRLAATGSNGRFGVDCLGLQSAVGSVLT
jgi:hypothetical protein